MIKAIVFDCFGVLVQEWLAILAEPYPQNTREALWDIVKSSNMGFIDYKDSAKQMAEVLGITEEALNLARINNEVRNTELLGHIKLLKEQGYKIGVLSNVSAGGITRRFSEEEIKMHFDAVVESGAVGFTKPDTKAYTYTAGLLDVQPNECIMIDDREDFCAGAEMAGMASILYKDFVTYSRDITALLA